MHMLNSSDDILPAALHYLRGKMRTRQDAGPILESAALVTKIRPFVRKFHSSEYVNAPGLWRDLLGPHRIRRRYRAGAKANSRGKNNIEIKYVNSRKERHRYVWFDNLAIPRDAKREKVSRKLTPSSISCRSPK